MLTKFMKHLCCLFIVGRIKFLLDHLLFYIPSRRKHLSIDTALLEDHLICSERACFVSENKFHLSHLLDEI